MPVVLSAGSRPLSLADRLATLLGTALTAIAEADRRSGRPVATGL